MAKDPAFLFYPSDFLTGTMFMNNEQIGIYVRLLCSQHQHGGIIDKLSFDSLVKNDPLIKSKFIETEMGFYNQRLADEMELRSKKSTNISEAVRKVWEKRRDSNGIPLESNKKPKRKVMRIEDVNEDEVINYFKEKGYKKDAAIKFYEFYNSAKWVDSNGKPVLNWKQKANSVWFKDENKEMNGASLNDQTTTVNFLAKHGR